MIDWLGLTDGIFQVNTVESRMWALSVCTSTSWRTIHSRYNSCWELSNLIIGEVFVLKLIIAGMCQTSGWIFWPLNLLQSYPDVRIGQTSGVRTDVSCFWKTLIYWFKNTGIYSEVIDKAKHWTGYPLSGFQKSCDVDPDSNGCLHVFLWVLLVPKPGGKDRLKNDIILIMIIIYNKF